MLQNKENKVSFGLEDKQNIEQKEAIPVEERKEKPKKHKKRRKSGKVVKEPNSALINIRNLNLETERRDKSNENDRPNSGHLNVIAEEQKEESVMDPEGDNHELEKKDNLSQVKTGFSLNISPGLRNHRAKSLNIKMSDKNKINLEQYFSSTSDSPVKQEFLPISTKNVILEGLDPKPKPSTKSINPFKPQFISTKDVVEQAQLDGPVLEKKKKKNIEGAMTIQPHQSQKTLSLLRKVTLRAKHNLKHPQQTMHHLQVKPNPKMQVFQKSFQKLKSVLRENPNDMQRLKPETKK